MELNNGKKNASIFIVMGLSDDLIHFSGDAANLLI